MALPYIHYKSLDEEYALIEVFRLPYYQPTLLEQYVIGISAWDTTPIIFNTIIYKNALHCIETKIYLNKDQRASLKKKTLLLSLFVGMDITPLYVFECEIIQKSTAKYREKRLNKSTEITKEVIDEDRSSSSLDELVIDIEANREEEDDDYISLDIT